MEVIQIALQMKWHQLKQGTQVDGQLGSAGVGSKAKTSLPMATAVIRRNEVLSMNLILTLIH